MKLHPAIYTLIGIIIGFICSIPFQTKTTRYLSTALLADQESPPLKLNSCPLSTTMASVDNQQLTSVKAPIKNTENIISDNLLTLEYQLEVLNNQVQELKINTLRVYLSEFSQTDIYSFGSAHELVELSEYIALSESEVFPEEAELAVNNVLEILQFRQDFELEHRVTLVNNFSSLFQPHHIEQLLDLGEHSYEPKFQHAIAQLLLLSPHLLTPIFAEKLAQFHLLPEHVVKRVDIHKP